MREGLASLTQPRYAGLIAKISYLQELGITAVELLLVFQFDTQEAPQFAFGQVVDIPKD